MSNIKSLRGSTFTHPLCVASARVCLSILSVPPDPTVLPRAARPKQSSPTNGPLVFRTLFFFALRCACRSHHLRSHHLPAWPHNRAFLTAVHTNHSTLSPTFGLRRTPRIHATHAKGKKNDCMHCTIPRFHAGPGPVARKQTLLSLGARTYHSFFLLHSSRTPLALHWGRRRTTSRDEVRGAVRRTYASVVFFAFFPLHEGSRVTEPHTVLTLCCCCRNVDRWTTLKITFPHNHRLETSVSRHGLEWQFCLFLGILCHTTLPLCLLFARFPSLLSREGRCLARRTLTSISVASAHINFGFAQPIRFYSLTPIFYFIPLCSPESHCRPAPPRFNHTSHPTAPHIVSKQKDLYEAKLPTAAEGRIPTLAFFFELP